MEEYFSYLDTSKIITLIGVLIGLIGLIYAYYQNRKNKVERQIKLNRGKTYSFFEKNPSLKTDELSILWNEKQIDNIFLLDIFLKNSGTISLKKEDFLKPISISFNENIEILKAKLYSSSAYSKLYWSYEKDKIHIWVDLIESKKILKIEIIYANEKVSPVDVEVAILDGNNEIIKLDDFGKLNETRELVQDYDIRNFIFEIIFFIVIFGFWFVFTLASFKDQILSSRLALFSTIMFAIIVIILFINSKYKKMIDFKNISEWTEYKPNSFSRTNPIQKRPEV